MKVRSSKTAAFGFTYPLTLPIAHIILISPNHLPLSLNVTRSVTITYVKAMIPPPPTPWTLLPTSKTVKSRANAAMMVPAVKKVKASKTIGLRPKMCEKDAKLG